ncbi:hypothetical protein [Sporosarcina sp. Te-1]|uniref:hypothetical protein n=1 Tax=Sporosarcina sp. Te-1 TaxID=2818390 RepID=UPI001A9CDFAC|nr:hypothetical protein [Sporosarcina sp. Te-1]QTD40621.1 hypothetical protein J3U78_17940 [Sporosarcina sp. Te-1]
MSLDLLLKRLPSHYNKSTDSNNYKALSLVAKHIEANGNLYKTIQKFWDVDQAEGAGLDRLGKDEGISRGSFDDETYSKMIKIQYIVNMSEGDIESLNAILTAYMGDGFVNIEEGWNSFLREGTYPTDGRHTDGYWYIQNSRVNASIAPPGPFTVPEIGAVLEPKQALTLTFGASTAPSISTYEVQSRYNENPWTDVGTHTNALTRAFTVTEDKTLKTVEFRVRAKNTSNVYSDYIYSDVFTVQHNKIPSITLNTENNKTLYENDTFVIDGSALEPDVGDVLIVYYRINGGLARGFATKVSDGTAMPYKETLTFKSGKLLRGDTAITDTLKEGTPYTLEVWAEDNQGGKSDVETRTYYVVPNRPPTLSIDPVTEASGMIDSDKVTIDGMSADPDGNNVTVRYRINEETAVQIHNGPAGPFTFDVQLSKLKDGENTIVVEAIDTHDFKVSKTITLNKSPNQTPLAKSVQRYTIVPPAGNAKVVYLWLERDASERVQVDISMTNGTEPESFVPMIWNDEDSKADPQPVTIAPGIVEDFLKFQSEVPAEKIVIQLSWTGDKPLFKVTGALLK